MVSLDHVHHDLVIAVGKILAAMDTLGFPMKVVQTVRTTEEQQALYAKGRTAPGTIVTNCDGIKNKSNHQCKADGYGWAVDLAFCGPDPFGEAHPWALYGAMVRALGLTWGGDFHSLPDRPHAELKARGV